MSDRPGAPRRRTWPQRLTVVSVLAVALACFATAAALALGQWVLSDRQLVALDEPESAFGGVGAGPVVVVAGSSTTVASEQAGSQPLQMPADPGSANFLVVGADNNDCAPDGSPVVDDRVALGERSDTIMIWRADPADDLLAVLSLPRDLYVDVAGGRKARINSTYVRNDPSGLIDTIFLNFGIPIDHYVQVDFCAFHVLVDAVGGVEIPFSASARDPRSGLVETGTGCVNLDGDQALAYVRSRYYQYEDPPGSGNWERDGTSDFGRIARQQDFIRRTVAKIIDDGLYSPSVATALIETNRDYLVTDSGLTVRRMLEFAGAVRRLDPATIVNYRVDSTTEVTASGDQVERPRIGGETMQSVLAVFRGEARIAPLPDDTVTTTPVTTDPGDDTVTTATLPPVVIEDNTVGVAPDSDVFCD